MKKHIENMAEDILEEYTNCYSEVDQECLEKMLRKLVSEVAEEIFAEIVEILNSVYRSHDADSVKAILAITKDIAELKKKYTEGDENG